MPFMQPSRFRLLCRSHNPFSPSIVPWHHFVVPNQGILRQQCLSSFVADPAQPAPPDNFDSSTVSVSDAPLNPGDKSINHGDTGPPIRRVHSSYQVQGPGVRFRIPKATREALAISRKAASQGEDYEGVVARDMPIRYKVLDEKLPWTLPLSDRKIYSPSRLGIEMERFHEYMKPTKIETLARKHLIEQVRDFVHQVLPDYAIEVFGSERTGLASATSDIDLRLFQNNKLPGSEDSTVPPPLAERKKRVEALSTLYVALKTHPQFQISSIMHARYPLLTLSDRLTHLNVQIVLCNDTSRQRAIIQDFFQKYPYLSQLYIIIKTTMDIRGLSNVFCGGFGSYPILMMIVASLQQRPHKDIKAADALRYFFTFWSKFDTRSRGISIDPPLLFQKSEKVVMPAIVKHKIEQAKIKPKPIYMLTLQDPADKTNDLGRQATSIKHFQKTCEYLVQQMNFTLATGVHSALANLVGTSFAVQEIPRRKLESSGLQIARSLKVSPELAKLAETIREADKARNLAPLVDSKKRIGIREIEWDFQKDDETEKKKSPRNSWNFKKMEHNVQKEEEPDETSLLADVVKSTKAHQPQDPTKEQIQVESNITEEIHKEPHVGEQTRS